MAYRFAGEASSLARERSLEEVVHECRVRGGLAGLPLPLPLPPSLPLPLSSWRLEQWKGLQRMQENRRSWTLGIGGENMSA
jgi:hypothetical protein